MNCSQKDTKVFVVENYDNTNCRQLLVVELILATREIEANLRGCVLKINTDYYENLTPVLEYLEWTDPVKSYH